MNNNSLVTYNSLYLILPIVSKLFFFELVCLNQEPNEVHTLHLIDMVLISLLIYNSSPSLFSPLCHLFDEEIGSFDL